VNINVYIYLLLDSYAVLVADSYGAMLRREEGWGDPEPPPYAHEIT